MYLPYHFCPIRFHDMEVKYSETLFCTNIIKSRTQFQHETVKNVVETWKDLEVQQHLWYDTKLGWGSKVHYAVQLSGGNSFCKVCL
jgi:hypothetical protein